MAAPVRRLLAVALVLASTPALAQDADGDGAPDGADRFPCDPAVAAESFAPAEGAFGALYFEDFWPVGLDNDYNDAVVAYHYAFQHAPDGRVVRIRATFDVLAAGGEVDLGLGLQLPVSAASVTQASRRLDGGAAQPVLPRSGDARATFTLSSDIRGELFGAPWATPVNVGVEPDRPGAPLEITVEFAAPVALDTATAPFDVFVFRRGTDSHEIHGIDHCGTSRMDATLFGTGVDRSDLVAGRCFVDQHALPSALHLPSAIRYPRELQDIAQVYPRVLSWAASGGAQDADWYTTPVDGEGYASAPSPAFAAGAAPGFARNTACLPATSCADLLAGGQTASGVYAVDLDGAGPQGPTEVYCDMTTAGGGWTLALNLDTSDGHVMWWHNPLWQNGALYGADSPDLSGDYKGQPFLSTPGGDVLLVVHQQGMILGYTAFGGRDTTTPLTDYLNGGTNVRLSQRRFEAWTSPALWSGEHLVRASNVLWANQDDNFSGGYCHTADYDRICSDTCKVGGNDGGGLGNCHDCTQAPNWRTTSEAQAGWHSWYNNSPCYPGTPHRGLGFFGTDTAYPATARNTNVANQASWASANGYAYDYAILVRPYGQTHGPARSCRDHYAGGARADGTYTVDLGSGPRQVYCDMTRDGGGWTLVQVGTDSGTVNLMTDAAVGTVSSPDQGTSAKLSRADIGALLRAGQRRFRYGRARYAYLFLGPITDATIDQGHGSPGYGTTVVPYLVSTTETGVGTRGTRFAWPTHGVPAGCSNLTGATGECSAGLHLGTWNGNRPDGVYLNGSPHQPGVHQSIDYELWVR